MTDFMKSPDQYLEELARCVEERVKKQIEDHHRNLTKKLFGEIVGFEIDHWGEVRDVNDTLRKNVLSRIDASVIDAFHKAIAEDIEVAMQKFIASPNNALRKEFRFRSRLDYFLEQQVEKAMDKQVGRVQDALEEALGEIIDRNLDKTLTVWKVAKRLQDANAKQSNDND